LLPLASSVPGGGNALVTSTTAGFYLGNRRHTYLSSITFSPSTNFRGEFNLPFRSNIWSEGNTWNFQGDTRFTIYPQYTWGIGGDKLESDRILIRSSYVRFYQNALKRIRPYLLAGFGYNLDYHIDLRPDIDSINLPAYTKYAYGTANNSNQFSSGLSFNLLYDTRNNSINPIPGIYAAITYRANPSFMGSKEFWHSLFLDFRKYIPFDGEASGGSGQNVLAIWAYYWTVMGSHAPYLDLPAIGWDAYQRSGRGFYTGRYMGNSLFYTEAEYRRDITENGLFGFVVFSNLNVVSEPDTHQYSYLHPAAGTGLRIKFNKHSATNVAMDIGFSKGYTGLYFNLGEAF
jgi:outer membrane protein assembly factor BamA